MIEFDKKIREDDILPYGKWGLFRTLIDNFVLILNNHGPSGTTVRFINNRKTNVERIHYRYSSINALGFDYN